MCGCEGGGGGEAGEWVVMQRCIILMQLGEGACLVDYEQGPGVEDAASVLCACSSSCHAIR